MGKHKITPKNIDVVMKKFVTFFNSNIKGSGEEERIVIGKLNDLFDDLLDDDVFGTEGQCDPRGDNRD